MDLYGEDIPIVSRILAVTDAYDAMTEDRIYRKALPRTAAIREREQIAGTQFEPNIARLFLSAVETFLAIGFLLYYPLLLGLT